MHMRLRIVLLFLLCAGATHPAAAPERIQVLVSIAPQRFMVERIAGDAVETTVLLPPGAAPETYEPTPRPDELELR